METRLIFTYLDDLLHRYPCLSICENAIKESYYILEKCFLCGGKVLIAGNGGSAADSEHIVGELMKGFCSARLITDDFAATLQHIDLEMGLKLSQKLQGALPAIALDNHSALNTAISNDVDGLLCFAQQVYGYGNENDVFWGISTSGNSQNILHAAIVAKAKKMKVIGLTGMTGGKLAKLSNVAVTVPEIETFKIQELHLPIYHCLCLMLEKRFFE